MKQSTLGIRIRQKWRQPQTKIAAAAIGVIVAVTITPFCGFLFACGCTWPGLGLEFFCNIYNPFSRHQCPWCASQWAGLLSVSFSAYAGVAISACTFRSYKDQKVFEVIGRILFGTGVFLMAALIFGVVSASLQNYPLGLWQFFD
ncbi:MAG: hypothetical protein ACXWTH_13765 [Methylosarcina sp.]